MLDDEELQKLAVEDEFLLYCDQEQFDEIARAAITAWANKHRLEVKG